MNIAADKTFFFFLIKKYKYLSYFCIDCLTEVLLMSTHNICFHEELRKIFIGQDKNGYQVNIFSYFSMKTYVVDTH